MSQTLLVNNDIWVYENGKFIGTLNTGVNATTAYTLYPIEFSNQLTINLILKQGNSKGDNNDNGQTAVVVVQLSSGILSIKVTLPESFNKKVHKIFDPLIIC